MLLGPFSAVQTLMAHGLAIIPSTGKLDTVSQPRFVFDWGWGCASSSKAFGLGVQWTLYKDCFWTIPLEVLWVGKKQMRGYRGLSSVQKIRSRETGFSIAGIIVCTFITACWGSGWNWISWVTVSLIPPTVSVLPRAPQVYLIPKLTPVAKNRGRMRTLKNQPSLWYNAMRAHTCVKHSGGSAEMPDAINQLVVIWLTQLRLEGQFFYLLLQLLHASAVCPCHCAWIVAQQLLCHWHSDFLLHWWETERLADSYGGLVNKTTAL